MKNFSDVWSILFDDKNKPLFGRVDFCDPITTLPKDVYSDTGLNLGSSIYVNAMPVNQIMLGDGDYTIRYYRYIGNGNMTVDDNEESWFLYKTELVKDPISRITLDFGFDTVDTIAELKDLTDMSDSDIICVMGYYAKGDVAPRFFQYHENAPTVSDDGGFYIKPDESGPGIWKWLISGDTIDVRYFGAFPNSTSSDTECQLPKLASAASKANLLDKNLYFPSCSNGGTGYYLFDGSNSVSIGKDIICDEVRFIVKENTTGTTISCHELKKCTKFLFDKAASADYIGHYSLYCDWSNSSWFKSYNPAGARVGYIIDAENSPGQYVNANIKINGTVASNTSFTNCNILEVSTPISNNVMMYSMPVKADWFTSNYNWNNLLISNCKLNLTDLKDADTYILLKNKQNENDYGDLGEQTLHNAIISTGSGCIVENCSGSATLAGTGACEMHNVSLTLTVNSGSQIEINAVDSWLTIGSIVLNKLAIRRGSLAGMSLQVLSELYLDNVDVTATINVMGVTGATIKNSVLYAEVKGTDLNLTGNTIYSKVESWPNGTSFTFNLFNNTFDVVNNHVGYHHLTTGAVAGAQRTVTVNGKWVGNFATYSDAHWIQVRQHGIKKEDNNCLYVNNAEPYFDAKNKNYIRFYGILININTDHSDKDRVRLDIPLIMINKCDNRVFLGNFKIYGFCLDRVLDPTRVNIYCTDPVDYTLSDAYDPNKLVFNSYQYGYVTTASDTVDYLNYEFTNYELSPSTAIDEKYKLGNESGFITSPNLSIYDHSLGLWVQNDDQGLPMAKKDLKFTVLQGMN